MSTAIKNRWADGAVVVVGVLFLTYGLVAWWPQPALKISPVVNQPVSYTPPPVVGGR